MAIVLLVGVAGTESVAQQDNVRPEVTLGRATGPIHLDAGQSLLELITKRA